MSDSGSFFSLPQFNRARIPWVTLVLIVANIAVFAYIELTGSSEDTQYMLQMGASYPPSIVEEHEYYRLFTHMFLHYGFMHLFNNMISLAVLGYTLEPVLGRVRFAVLYLLSGVLAGVISLFYELYMGEQSVAAGASGAIFGLLGALLVVLLKSESGRMMLVITRFVIYLVLCLYSGFMDTSIDHAAHVGGFLVGIVICLLLCIGKKKGSLTVGGIS